MAPSITTFQNQNPSFRVYELDSETFSINNFYQYRMNLDEVNKKSTIENSDWKVSYDFNSIYWTENLYEYEKINSETEKILSDD